MSEPPIREEHIAWITRALAVVSGMLVGGGLLGMLTAGLDVPYAAAAGTFGGALLVLFVFLLYFSRRDRTDAEEASEEP